MNRQDQDKNMNEKTTRVWTRIGATVTLPYDRSTLAGMSSEEQTAALKKAIEDGAYTPEGNTYVPEEEHTDLTFNDIHIDSPLPENLPAEHVKGSFRTGAPHPLEAENAALKEQVRELQFNLLMYRETASLDEMDIARTWNENSPAMADASMVAQRLEERINKAFAEHEGISIEEATDSWEPLMGKAITITDSDGAGLYTYLHDEYDAAVAECVEAEVIAQDLLLKRATQEGHLCHEAMESTELAMLIMNGDPERAFDLRSGAYRTAFVMMEADAQEPSVRPKCRERDD